MTGRYPDEDMIISEFCRFIANREKKFYKCLWKKYYEIEVVKSERVLLN